MTVRVTSTESSPATQFNVEADILSQSTVTNQSVVRVRMASVNLGNSGSNFSGPGYQDAEIVGHAIVLFRNQNPFLPSGVGTGGVRWNDFIDVVLTHDANGYYKGGTTFQVSMGLDYGAVGPKRLYSAAIPIPRIARVPGKPAAPTLRAGTLTPTGFDFNFTNAADNGSPILEIQHRISIDATYASGVSTQTDNSSPGTWSGRPPGTPQYTSNRQRNAVGWGPWSDTLTVNTLPAVAPGMVVAPSFNGQSASVALTPPGGATGVSKYTVEYRINGTTVTIDDPESPTSPIVVAGLTPGTTYDWRASAWFGTYQSPWTSWTPVAQPSPNTNPGQYFDGSSATRPDLTFTWGGTVNNSISIASAKPVKNWRLFADGNGTSGGTGVVYRATGGVAGDFAARVVFFTDAVAAGFIAGVARLGGFAVEANAGYEASIFIGNLPRAQRFQIGVARYDLAGVQYDTDWGPEFVVPAGVAYQRLAMLTVPPQAGRAAPVVRDVVGTGHSLWLGGEGFMLDAAMASLGVLYPYFDGNTPDSPGFDYRWAGVANQSISERRTLTVAATDPLADPDCAPLPSPPSPPIVDSDCIEEVGIWRRYAVSIPATEVQRFTSTLPTMDITTGSSAERQVRIRVYENPDGLAPDQIDLTTWDAEMILSFIPKFTTITLDGVTQRVWAEVAGGDPIPADRLLYGTDGVPATWPIFRCGIGYVVTFDVPLEAPPGNLTTAVNLTPRM